MSKRSIDLLLNDICQAIDVVKVTSAVDDT